MVDDDMSSRTESVHAVSLIQDLASSRIDGLPVQRRKELVQVVTDLLSENPPDRRALADHGGECTVLTEHPERIEHRDWFSF